jgi:TIR domain
MARYQYDVFISYARVNDLRSGWVSTFRQRLEAHLKEKLPGGTADVFLDLSDVGPGPLTPTFRNALSATAILLIVLSNRWPERDWCLQELDTFVKAVGSQAKAQERIALVRIEEVKQDRLPQILRNCRMYDFFTLHPTKKVIQTFGLPEFPDLERDYLLTLLELVGNGERPGLITRIIELDQSGEPSAKSAVPDERPIIFLCDGTPDLHRDRGTLRRHLEDRGFHVVPSGTYYHAPSNFEDDIRRLLCQAIVVIQIVGPFRFDPTPIFPNGYEAWQWEQARGIKGNDTLRWRRPDLRPEFVEDAAHRDFVFDSDVTACDLEEFKVTLENKLREIRSRRERTPEQSQGRFVLVNAASLDYEMARTIGEKVEELCVEMDLGYIYADIVGDGSSLFDIASNNAFDGLVVVYGECEERWVREQMDQWRRVALRLKRKGLICALYVGPPGKDSLPEPRPARFNIIDYREEDRLRDFVRQVAESGVLR